jgi:drug/metabolite transporter (DMT)-like permease
VLSQKLDLPTGAMGTAAEMLTGGVALTALSLARGEQMAGPLEPVAAGAWLYLVTFGSLVAFSAYMYLLARTRPALATSYAYVNPVIALLLGVVLAGETITWVGLVGIGVILVGVVLITLGKARQAARPAVSTAAD